MIEQLAWKLIILVACLPFFLIIGVISLLYNIHKFDYSLEAINIFLKSLPFPINKVYGNTGQDALAYINQATGKGSLLGKLIFSICPFIMIIAHTIEIFSNKVTVYEIVADMLLIVLIGFCLYRSWHFGNKLENKL
jgi:hypothetical protein